MGDHIVTAFDEDLIELRARISEMGGLAEQLFAMSLDSMEKRDGDMAKAVMRPDPAGGHRLVCQRELEASIYLAALTLHLWPKASELKIPTKLIGADPEGRGAPPTGPANKALADEGGYDYFGMEHAGHLLQIEKPDACREVLLSFLQGQGLSS